MSDFPGRRAYLLLLIVAALDVALLLHLPKIGVPTQQLLQMLMWPVICLGVVAALGRLRRQRQEDANAAASILFDRLVVLISGIVFLQLGWIALRLFNHLTMALGFPYVDEALVAADAMLGLSWIGYFDFVFGNPALLAVMGWSYQSLTAVSVVAFLALIALGEVRRGRFFLETFLVTACVCSALGFLFPAEAAVKVFIGGPEMFPGMHEPPGLYHLWHLERLRGDAPFMLDLNFLPGLVTIPSFHTAAGIILIWAFRQTWMFLPVTVYSAVMIASTPVLGGHYFIDLIAGTAVAVAVLAAFQHLAGYRDLFEAPTAQEADAQA